MKKIYGVITVSILIPLVVGYFLASLVPKHAEAQGLVSESGTTICVVGSITNARLPIILVDTREQTICIYRYDFNANSLQFSIARSYRWDKKLERYGNVRRPTPDQVKNLVERRNRRK